jgi:hypothetical protein
LRLPRPLAPRPEHPHTPEWLATSVLFSPTRACLIPRRSGCNLPSVRHSGLIKGAPALLLAATTALALWFWFQGLNLLFGFKPDTSSSLTALAVIGAGVCVVLILWLVPRAQMARWRRDGIMGKDLAELGNSSRATLTQALGGLALIATLALTAYQVNETRKTSERNLRVAEAGQATALLSHAVDQLGATADGKISTDTRVGALYSLARLVTDSRVGWRVLLVTSCSRMSATTSPPRAQPICTISPALSAYGPGGESFAAT